MDQRTNLQQAWGDAAVAQVSRAELDVQVAPFAQPAQGARDGQCP